MYNQKKKIILVMCIAILLMGVGYAAFATRLTINGTGEVTSSWNIYIASIAFATKNGEASEASPPEFNGTQATLRINLRKPGDYYMYVIGVKNGGTIDAIVNDMKVKVNGSQAIIYTIGGPVNKFQKGTKIKAGSTAFFDLKIEYDPTATAVPSNTSSEIIIDAEVVQDNGQTITTEPPVIKLPLTNQILKDNNPESDKNIDFSKPSSDTNGQGLYYTNVNTEDNGQTYYFRGEVTNNYVSFAGKLWRIVRINEDGSIRLVKNDLEGLANITNFNGSVNYNAQVGFMYGTPNATSYALEHANVNSSDVKQNLDSWYTINLSDFSSYLADTGFCGDRSLTSGTGYGSSTTTFAGETRYNNGTPQFKCPQINDLYTTKSSTKGNKALTNPIGLLTLDELMYIDGKGSSSSQTYMKSIIGNHGTWLMTPATGIPAVNVYAYLSGIIFKGMANYALPVINLKANVEITGGNGTESNPYIVKTS